MVIYLMLVRMQDPFNTDLLMSLSVPDKTGDVSDGKSDAFKKFLDESEKTFRQMVDNF